MESQTDIPIRDNFNVIVKDCNANFHIGDESITMSWGRQLYFTNCLTKINNSYQFMDDDYYERDRNFLEIHFLLDDQQIVKINYFNLNNREPYQRKVLTGITIKTGDESIHIVESGWKEFMEITPDTEDESFEGLEQN
jgi:hypothetical protein